MCRVSPEYELPRLDVSGGHGAPAHPLQPGDGEGETAARLLVQRLVLGRAETGGTVDISHLPWRPLNLNVSFQRRFLLPPSLFTHLMKNWGVPEIFAGKFLHRCQNFRGICKSIKNDIFGRENNLYFHFSHKGVIVRVKETISKLQNWHTCKNIRGTFPCNLSKCAAFHT